MCRDIVASNGLAAVSMRSVADQCQIALGTLYNYYDNKDELLLETVEDIWKDIFHMDSGCSAEQDKPFRFLWLAVVISFACYIPVVLFADIVPMVGMLMIPKTCAYVWIVLIGYKAMKGSN